MKRYRLLLRCVGGAVADHGLKCLLGAIPFAEKLYDIARDAYDRYKKEAEVAERLAQVEAAAQASLEDVKQEVAEVVQEMQAQASPQVRQQLQDPAVELALVSYLQQVPASIRSSMRRPADPSGRSVRAEFSLQSPEDLLGILPSGPPRFKPGDQPLAADWELVELLGKGGFGEVWKARHLTRSSQKPVALKFCLDPVAAASLRNEAALHDSLDRVRQQGSRLGIVPLLETYLRSDPPCIMYEYIEGGDLTSLIQEIHESGRLTPDIATRIIHRLATTIGIAHQLAPPLVHRDLKPSNVLVRRGERGKISLYIADFGIGGLAARQSLKEQESRRTSPSQSLPTAIRGAYTPLYASPQQVKGERPDPRDDVHGLGVMWYQLVTADLRLVSIPPDWRDVVEERGLSNEQIEVMASCITSRAEKRLPNALELAKRLTAFFKTRGKEDGTTTQGGKSAGVYNLRENDGEVRSERLQEQEIAKTSMPPVPPVAIGGLQSNDGEVRSERLQEREMVEAPVPPVRPVAISELLSVVVSSSGGGQFRSINEAIRAATVPMLKILIRPGLYRESVLLDRVVDLIADGSREQVVIEAIDGPCITMKTERAVVRGLTLKGRAGTAGKEQFAVDVPQGHLLLEDCDIMSDSLACVAIHGLGANTTLRNCKIHDSKKDGGVSICEQGKGTIESCDIFANKLGVMVVDQSKGTIESCDIFDNKGAGVITDGGDLSIRSCKIHDTKEGCGVVVCKKGTGTIEGCDIFANKFAGVLIYQGGNPTVRDCKIHDSKEGGGVFIHDQGKGTIEGCDIFTNKLAGVEISQEGDPTIRCCNIHGSKEGRGVFVHDQGKGTIEGCDIFANKLAGVEISQGGDPTVSYSKIHNSKEDSGVSICEQGKGTIESCDIFANKLVGVGIGGRDSNPTIRKCKIHDDNAGGVQVYGQGKGIIEGCDIFANQLAEVEITQGSDPIVRNCKIHDSTEMGGVFVFD